MASSDLKPTLSELGARVKELAETLERHLKEAEVVPPTLAADSPVNISKFTAEIFMTKQSLADALNDLSIVSQGPSESVFNYAHNVRKVFLFGAELGDVVTSIELRGEKGMFKILGKKSADLARRSQMSQLSTY